MCRCAVCTHQSVRQSYFGVFFCCLLLGIGHAIRSYRFFFVFFCSKTYQAETIFFSSPSLTKKQCVQFRWNISLKLSQLSRNFDSQVYTFRKCTKTEPKYQKISINLVFKHYYYSIFWTGKNGPKIKTNRHLWGQMITQFLNARFFSSDDYTLWWCWGSMNIFELSIHSIISKMAA